MIYWLFLAERVGFEPTVGCPTPDFESGPLWPLRYRSTVFLPLRCSGKRREKEERTNGSIEFSSLKKPKEFKDFLSGGFREVRTFSSQPRYDHFDTSPCMFQSAFIFAQISLRKLLERKAGEKTGKYSIFHFEIPYISRIPGKQNCQAGIYSESRLFWPLRYCSEASILYNTEIRFASTKFRLNNIIERHAGLSPMSIPMPIPISAQNAYVQ